SLPRNVLSLTNGELPPSERLPLPSAFALQVLDGNGKQLLLVRAPLQGPRTPAPPHIPRTALENSSEPITVYSGDDVWRARVVPLPGGRYAALALDLEEVQSTVARLMLIDGLAGLAALALLTVAGLWLVRASLRPLGDIERTAEAIAAGDLSQRIP